MARHERVDVKAILADPDLRRKLMVRTIQATQAREGIDTTEEQAERAYYMVTEGERTAFFDLEGFPPAERSARTKARSIRPDTCGKIRDIIASTSSDGTFARLAEHRSPIGE